MGQASSAPNTADVSRTSEANAESAPGHWKEEHCRAESPSKPTARRGQQASRSGRKVGRPTRRPRVVVVGRLLLGHGR